MDTSEYLGLFLDESAESLQTLGAALLELERAPGDPAPLSAVFRAAHTLKGMSATMGFVAMADLTHGMEEVLAAVRDSGAPLTAETLDALRACLDVLGGMLDRIAAGGTDDIDATTVAARLGASASGAGPAAARLGATLAPRRAADDDAPPPRGVRGTPTVRVGTDRLDDMAALVAEVAARGARLESLAERHGLADVREAAGGLSRATDGLEALVRRIRTTPVDAVFMRFPRMIRDLADALGKRLELVITGEGTELDRAVVDRLAEPLLHLLRNAVDHGLEAPAERASAGKRTVGRLHLSARREGGDVVVEVRDDGRGMDPDALRRAAARKGLGDLAALAALTDSQACDLVFLPGFTTAPRATEVSGRGVGMDAVRAAVTELGGEISIASAPGAGCAVEIRIPSAPLPAPPGGPPAARADGGDAQPSPHS